LRKSDNILNVEALLSRDLVPENMRFELSPENISFNNKLKPGEFLPFQKVLEKLYN